MYQEINEELHQIRAKDCACFPCTRHGFQPFSFLFLNGETKFLFFYVFGRIPTIQQYPNNNELFKQKTCLKKGLHE